MSTQAAHGQLSDTLVRDLVSLQADFLELRSSLQVDYPISSISLSPLKKMSQTKEPPPLILRRRKNIALDILARLHVKSLLRFRCIFQTKKARPRTPTLHQWKNYLPADIVLDILTRLPVKSLLRFRCIFKSWNSSITTPNFMSTHLRSLLSRNDHDNIIYILKARKCVKNTKAV